MPWEAEGASDCARGSPGHTLVELLAAGGLGLCLGYSPSPLCTYSLTPSPPKVELLALTATAVLKMSIPRVEWPCGAVESF